MVDQRRDRQRGVRGAAGDYDVGALAQRLHQRFGADIGIGCDQPRRFRVDAVVGLVHRQLVQRDAAADIVAADHGDAAVRQAEPQGQPRHQPRRGGGIGGAEIAEDGDAVRHAVAQHRLQQPLQHRLVAELRVAPAFQLRQGHGALAQRLEEQRRGQAAGDQAADHRDGRIDPVAGEAGAVADQEGVVHGRSLSGIIAPAVRRRNRPAPGPAARRPHPPARSGSPPGCRAGCGTHRMDGGSCARSQASARRAASASGRRHSSSGRPGLAPSGTRRSGSGAAARATASSRAVQGAVRAAGSSATKRCRATIRPTISSFPALQDRPMPWCGRPRSCAAGDSAGGRTAPPADRGRASAAAPR